LKNAAAFQELTAKAQEAINTASRANLEKSLEIAGGGAALAQARAEDAANAVRSKLAGVQDPILLAIGEKEAQAAAANVTAEFQKQQSLLNEHIRLTDAKTAAQKTILSGNASLGNQLLVENEIEARALDIEKQRGISYEEAYRVAKDQVTTQNSLKEATQGERDARRDISDLLRQDSALLRNLEQQQRLIEQSPSLSADARQSLLGANAIAQQGTLSDAIGKTGAALQEAFASGNTDEVIRLGAELDNLKFHFQELGFTVQTSGFGGELQKSLADWVNGFGTAGQQIGQTIQGTINASLQGTNQLLVGAITHSGNWRQTLVGVEGQVLNLFLTLLEQMALQALMAKLHITTNAATQATANAGIAASAAPAAAATSIASYGSAAVIGTVAALVAIGAIIAAISGGFPGRRLHWRRRTERSRGPGPSRRVCHPGASRRRARSRQYPKLR
jgi:hypothetical protein